MIHVLCSYTINLKSGVTLFMRKTLLIILYLHFAQQRQPSAEVRPNIRWRRPNIRLGRNSKI